MSLEQREGETFDLAERKIQDGYSIDKLHFAKIRQEGAAAMLRAYDPHVADFVDIMLTYLIAYFKRDSQVLALQRQTRLHQTSTRLAETNAYYTTAVRTESLISLQYHARKMQIYILER